ncbi:MAG: sugar phosphorylase [Pseudomonadota bacterium]
MTAHPSIQSNSSFSRRLDNLLTEIYPEEDLELLSQKVVEAFWPEGRHRRNQGRKPGNKLWSEKDAVLITYGNTLEDGLHKPLDILHDFLLNHMKGLVNGVHILPFFPFTSDDGFAVSDYYSVSPQLGDWEDISRIADDFHVVSDLVLNHVSSQGNWFNAFRQGQTPYDDFFFTAQPEDDLSAVVRPRTTPLLREVRTSNGPAHVWCTFSHDQVDLNFKNPEVLLEMLRIIRLHIDQGVRTLRLDAVAYIWKEVGTSCIHLPQTHAIVRLLRLLCDYNAETVILLTETNVPRAENLSYFGNRNEAHAVYNFSLPPLILHALLSGCATYLQSWQASMPPAQLGCAYLNFTASHDGIGMRPAEGVLPSEEIEKVISKVTEEGGLVSMRALPDGREAPYELNCGYFDALQATFQGDRAHHLDRFLCSQTIVMSLEGIPAFYIHSFLATPNDYDGVERRKMNRAINRHRWHYPDLLEILDDETSNASKVIAQMLQRLQLRGRQPAFHPNATQFTLRLDERVFGVWRQSLDRSQSIFALHNLSADALSLSTTSVNLIEGEEWFDLLTGEGIAAHGDGIDFAPYQCRWVTNRRSK